MNDGPLRRGRSRLARTVTLASLALLAFVLVACDDDTPSSPRPYTGTSSDLCIMLEDADPDVLAALASEYDFRVVGVYGNSRFAFVAGDVTAEELRLDERILAVQGDAETAISSPVEITMSFFEGDFDDDLPGQDAFAAWSLPYVHSIGRGQGVKVAVLDTGVDPTHPLLRDHVALVPENAGSLGSIEVARGVDTDGDGEIDEAFGHGTHVAGTILTVAPDVEVLSLRVLDSDGVGTAFDLARGLYEAYAWGAQVINLSLVLSGESDVVDAILNDLHSDGVVVVGAAGNRPGRPAFPASESEVLSIAAHDASRVLASFSAAEGVRLAAPGVEVLSAFPGERWASATGTSMACAAATGAVAVLAGVAYDADRAVGALRNTALELEPVNDGAIDILGALAEASGTRRP